MTSSIPIIDLDHDEDMVEEETATGVVDPQRRGWVASLVNIISLRRSRTDATALGGDQQARRDPPRPPSCWKCTVDFSFTNRSVCTATSTVDKGTSSGPGCARCVATSSVRRA